MQRLRPLVMGTDFSPGADQALAMAMNLALAARTRITLVHVCELPIDGVDEERLRHCREALAAVIAEHRHRGVEMTGVVRSGRPWKKLDNLAAEVGASLIVIGRRGASGRSVELGSVAEQLVRWASRAVLTVTADGNGIDDELDAKDFQRKDDTT